MTYSVTDQDTIRMQCLTVRLENFGLSVWARALIDASEADKAAAARACARKCDSDLAAAHDMAAWRKFTDLPAALRRWADSVEERISCEPIPSN